MNPIHLVLELGTMLGLCVCTLATPVLLVAGLFSSARRSYYLRRALQCFFVALSCGLLYFGLLGGGRYQQPRAQGKLTACKSNLKNIATSLEMYSTDNHGLYPKSLASLIPNYLKIIPNCPAAAKDSYSDTFQSYCAPKPDAAGNSPAFYTVICQGEHHKDAAMTANFPQYSSTAGLIVP